MDLPLHGVTETLLPAEADEARRRLAEILDSDPARRTAELKALVGAHPAFLDGWAHLAGEALEAGDAVQAYAFARTGYHRGLDRIRQHGWRGKGAVPWRHEPNRGFLRSVRALWRAADAIGETDEAERCRTFLLELDPDDALGVGR
jgi:hypothetical protein